MGGVEQDASRGTSAAVTLPLHGVAGRIPGRGAGVVAGDKGEGVSSQGSAASDVDEGDTLARPGVCELSVDGRFRRIDDELCRSLRRPRELLLGRKLDEIVAPSAARGAEELFVRVLDTGEPRSDESRLLLPDGTELIVTLAFTRLEDEQGRARGIFGLVTDLTERRRTLEALEESRERYRTLFHSIDEGFCVLEALFDERGRPEDFRFVEVNPGVQRQTGLPNLRGKRLNEVLSVDDEPWWIDLCGKVVLTGRAERVQLESPGLQRCFDLFVFPLGPPDAKRIAAIFRDITDRRRREQNEALLVELHRVFGELSSPAEVMHTAGERILEHLGAEIVFFAEIDESGERTQNPVTVYQAGGVMLATDSYRIADYMTEEHLALIRAGRTVAIDDIREHPLTKPVAAAYARYRICAQLQAPHLRDGRLRFLLGLQQRAPRDWKPHEIDLVRELSAQIWLRLERARAEDALRVSEARARLALSAADMGMWTWDPGTDEITYDERMAEVFSAPPGGRVTGTWLMQHRIHPDDGPAVLAALRGALRKEDDGRYRVEYRVRRPDGEIRWFSGYGLYFEEWREGRCKGWLLGVGLDITDRKRAEEALRENDRRKDEFLATLAHELRNPLAPLEHGLEILRLHSGQGDATERVRQIMARQVSHMCRLVDDLLEVSRITRGKIELRTERIEVGQVLRGVLDAWRAGAERAGHHVVVALPGEPLYVRGDSVRLAQVFANLLNNAVKYTEPGGRIEVGARHEDGKVVVSVRDNGVGIAPEMLPRIFDMFAQVDRASNRSQGGLGIGLTLVRSLVQLHGGTVTAYSAGVGQGAEFVVTLPEAVERRTSIQLPEDEARPLSKACRVLVVDDNRDAAESLGTLLEMIGADVRVEYDGASALRTFAAYHPSVVLLDLGMPGMDGFEVARRIREQATGEDAMLVAMTGWGQEEDRRRTREAGFAHHLVKPAELRSLRRLLSATVH